jgi:hypothetical protein
LIPALFSGNDDGNIHTERVALKESLINLSELKLQFFNFHCVVESPWREVLQRLEHDFSAFKREKSLKQINLYVYISKGNVEAISLPSQRPSWSRSFVRTYYKYPLLVNDYSGEVRSQLNLKTESAHIASPDIHRAHEVAYLLILSRIGKMMELHHLHKIHAMAVTNNKSALCLSMDSKGGKSTILQSLITDHPEWKILSDDCPVINDSGQILAFPLRLGLSDKSAWRDHPEKYELNRMRFGSKNLLDIKHLPFVPAGEAFDSYTLVFAKRTNVLKPVLKSHSRLVCLCLLIKPFFIGIGLPLILEYFWEPGVQDFWRKTRIALSRLRAGIMVSRKAKCYSLEINDDLEATKAILRDLI